MSTLEIDESSVVEELPDTPHTYKIEFTRKQLCCTCAGIVALTILLSVCFSFLLDPYRVVTGNYGFIWPENYGKVQEKTIWLYWNKPTLPDHLQLMYDVMVHNKGSFDVRLVTQSEVTKYVSRTELPFHWDKLFGEPAKQKDAVMNALLARYGGVAFDASIVLFESLDTWWDEMVAKHAIFRGFMYDHIETVVWFLMSRAGGIFGHAVANQVISLGSWSFTNHVAPDHQGMYFALGDGTVTPVIGRYDYSRKKCKGPKQKEGVCNPPLPEDNVPELGRELLMISNPQEGPQLPYAIEDDHNFFLWKISERKDEWNEFKRRRNAGLMPFVKAFSGGGSRLKKMKKAEILEQKESFLCYFLCLAGTNQCDIDCSSEFDNVTTV